MEVDNSGAATDSLAVEVGQQDKRCVSGIRRFHNRQGAKLFSAPPEGGGLFDR
jgi:hypothetical protein